MPSMLCCTSVSFKKQILLILLTGKSKAEVVGGQKSPSPRYHLLDLFFFKRQAVHFLDHFSALRAVYEVDEFFCQAGQLVHVY